MAKRPDYPFVKHFRNRHRDQPFIVSGLGESAPTLSPTYLSHFITVGVNDYSRIGYDPDYLVVIDGPDGLDKAGLLAPKPDDAPDATPDLPPQHRSRFVLHALTTRTILLFNHPRHWNGRIPDIDIRSDCFHIAANPPWSWQDPRKLTEPVFYADHFSGKRMPRGPMLPQWCCSPHLAIHFAAFCGASAIGMIGVDMSPDRFFERTPTPHGLASKTAQLDHIFGKTHEALRDELDIPLYNLSNISQLVSVPYMDPTEFKRTYAPEACPSPSESS